MDNCLQLFTERPTNFDLIATHHINSVVILKLYGRCPIKHVVVENQKLNKWGTRKSQQWRKLNEAMKTQLLVKSRQSCQVLTLSLEAVAVTAVAWIEKKLKFKILWNLNPLSSQFNNNEWWTTQLYVQTTSSQRFHLCVIGRFCEK